MTLWLVSQFVSIMYHTYYRFSQIYSFILTHAFQFIFRIVIMLVITIPPLRSVFLSSVFFYSMTCVLVLGHVSSTVLWYLSVMQIIYPILYLTCLRDECAPEDWTPHSLDRTARTACIKELRFAPSPKSAIHGISIAPDTVGRSANLASHHTPAQRPCKR